MSLAEIVNVQITRETTAVSRAGFGTALILGPNLNSASRVQAFTDLSSIADAVAGGSSSNEYKAAADMLAQNPRVVSVKIGQIQGEKILTDDAGTYTAGSIKVTVNGTEITEAFDTDKDTTLTNLAASIQALSDVSTAVYSSVAHTITITPATGKALSVSSDLSGITGNMTVTLSANATEAINDALDNIKIEDNDWYGLVTVTRTKADQLLAAAWIETERKVYSLASSESDIIDTTDAADTTSIAAQLKAGSYARSFPIFSNNTSTEFPDAALIGRILPYDPGEYTAMFKTLASITVDSLTSTQSTNARDKNCNVYEQIGGVNIVREGKVAEGEYIDVIIFIDWLQARITESVYTLLVNNLKVPYTEDGIAAVKNAIDQPLKVGQNRGGISPDSQDSDKNQNGGYVITTPAFEDIPTADKTNRLLQDVKFTAWLAGAIHAVTIDGVVTL